MEGAWHVCDHKERGNFRDVHDGHGESLGSLEWKRKRESNFENREEKAGSSLPRTPPAYLSMAGGLRG
jgi:hypothetical protein